MSHAYEPESTSQNTSSPAEEHGDFLSTDAYNPVENAKVIDINKSHTGVEVHNQLMTMANGRRYITTSTHIPPEFRTPISNIAVVEKHSWTTRGKGYNLRRQLARAQDIGLESDFTGVQQNLDRWGSLEESAHDILEIGKFTAQQFDRDPDNIMLEGISEGAMTTLASAALASRHGVHVICGQHIVPCFPEGLDIQRDLPEYVRFLINEIPPIISLGKVSLKALMYYPQTIDMTWRGPFQHIKEVPTLLSGAVGNIIDEHLPKDYFGHVALYDGDIMSQGQNWQKKLHPDRFPNIVIDLEPGGGHLSCVSNNCYADSLERTATIADILLDDPTARTIGHTALRQLAAARNSSFASAS